MGYKLRYLKLFEDVNTDGYELISIEAFNKGLPDKVEDLVPFSSHQIDKLLGFGFLDTNNNYKNILDKRFSIDGDIIVYKTDDEWYYLSDDRYEYNFYKCDQWEGLMNCLKKELKLS